VRMTTIAMNIETFFFMVLSFFKMVELGYRRGTSIKYKVSCVKFSPGLRHTRAEKK